MADVERVSHVDALNVLPIALQSAALPANKHCVPLVKPMLLNAAPCEPQLMM